MDIVKIIFLAVGLSMDSLIIALASGAIVGNHKVEYVLKIAGMLAFIQMGLTVVGWLVGSAFVHYIDKYDHWVAFAILVFLGVKVIVEALRGDGTQRPFNPLDIRVMFGLALATSIDATAVGLSLSLVNHPIFYPALIVGIVTLIATSLGVVFGCKAGCRYNLKLNIIGGVILILIGCNILTEHTILAVY